MENDSPARVRKERTLRWYFLVGIVLGFVILLAIFYMAGYRPGPDLTLAKTGTLMLQDLPPGTTVYADGRLKGSAHDDTMRLRLVPGTHTLIVDAHGYHSWSDTVDVSQEGVAALSPILVPEIIERIPLSPEDALSVRALAAAQTLPTATNPLIVNSGCTQTYVATNRILSTSTSTPECPAPQPQCQEDVCEIDVVFASQAPIAAVIRYPGREDALIVSYGDTVAVIELDPLSPQFFAPLIRHEFAIPFVWKDGLVVVTDTEVFRVSL